MAAKVVRKIVVVGKERNYSRTQAGSGQGPGNGISALTAEHNEIKVRILEESDVLVASRATGRAALAIFFALRLGRPRSVYSKSPSMSPCARNEDKRKEGWH
jgi:hypothetical protein